MAVDYTNLRRLLEGELYPHRYTHKVIGRTTFAFEAGVASLEARFPRVVRVARRESAAPGGGASQHVAYTFELPADGPDEILEMLAFTETLPDVLMML